MLYYNVVKDGWVGLKALKAKYLMIATSKLKQCAHTAS